MVSFIGFIFIIFIIKIDTLLRRPLQAVLELNRIFHEKSIDIVRLAGVLY